MHQRFNTLFAVGLIGLAAGFAQQASAKVLTEEQYNGACSAKSLKSCKGPACAQTANDCAETDRDRERAARYEAKAQKDRDKELADLEKKCQGSDSCMTRGKELIELKYSRDPK